MMNRGSAKKPHNDGHSITERDLLLYLKEVRALRLELTQLFADIHDCLQMTNKAMDAARRAEGLTFRSTGIVN